MNVSYDHATELLTVSSPESGVTVIPLRSIDSLVRKEDGRILILCGQSSVSIGPPPTPEEASQDLLWDALVDAISANRGQSKQRATQ